MPAVCRRDRVICHAAVASQGAVTYGKDHGFIQPLVEPFTERHATVLTEIDITVGFNRAMEFVECVLPNTDLCIGVPSFL